MQTNKSYLVKRYNYLYLKFKYFDERQTCKHKLNTARPWPCAFDQLEGDAQNHAGSTHIC
jgi:hypothetical protein